MENFEAISARREDACRACDNVKGNKQESSSRVYTCAACGAIFGTMYLGDSYAMVKAFMTSANVPSDRQRYFDFTTIGSAGISRRHGWFDPETRLITQVG
jgi:hypothetical protein